MRSNKDISLQCSFSPFQDCASILCMTQGRFKRSESVQGSSGKHTEGKINKGVPNVHERVKQKFSPSITEYSVYKSSCKRASTNQQTRRRTVSSGLDWIPYVPDGCNWKIDGTLIRRL